MYLLYQFEIYCTVFTNQEPYLKGSVYIRVCHSVYKGTLLSYGELQGGIPFCNKMATHFQNETDELATTANRNATLKEKDIQILSEIRDYKANGNELFRAGKIREAMRKYHNANLCLRTFQDSPVSSFGSRPDQVTSMSRLPQDTKEEVQALTISIANNLAGGYRSSIVRAYNNAICLVSTLVSTHSWLVHTLG